ncbi:MAG TPA: hypothetical protein VMI10_05115 [Terriglobales bacterium]|nr:hypothetical protein [Terriglobales bacterium]
MKSLKYLAMLAALMLPLALTQPAHAGVVVGFGVGPGYVDGPPVCEWGYYPYYPYACAPYGYYGTDWFVGGVFIGAGPWYGGWGHPYYPGYGYYNGWVARGYYGRGYGGRGYVGRGYEGRGYAGRGYEGHGYVGRGHTERGYPQQGYSHGPVNSFHGGESHGGGSFHGGGSSHGGGSFHSGGGRGGRR